MCIHAFQDMCEGMAEMACKNCEGTPLRGSHDPILCCRKVPALQKTQGLLCKAIIAFGYLELQHTSL